MPPQTPYTTDLAGREPLAAMRDAIARMQTLARDWTPAQFERTYAAGKWSARQILTHLAQTEIALGNRARMALASPGYLAQAFDQDRWMAIEAGGTGANAGGLADATGGAIALEALVGLNALNRALFTALTPQQRATPFSHPEYGALTVDWLIHQMGGHLLHHLQQLETIARS